MIRHLELVSIKVPRTGSESFGHVLKDLYPHSELHRFVEKMKFNPRIYDPDSWFYKDPQPSAPFQSELETFNPYDDRQYFHNHVPYSMVEGLWGYAPFVTFLREPISWLLSCFWFAKALGHIPAPMGVWEYVEIEYRQNWMSMLVGDLSKYDFVGFQETWKKDVESLFDRYTNYSSLDLWLSPLPALNVQTDQAYIRFRDDMMGDKMFIRRCKKLHKEDFKLYEEAKNEFATE